MLNRLVELTQTRINKTGAQYSTFACFGVITYPLAFLYELYIGNITSGSLWIRLISTILCLFLLLKDKWPENLQKFLPLYWYITLTVAIPVLGAYMVLIDNFSLSWLMNINIGVMILILLVDVYAFLIIEILGIVLGVLLFYFSGHFIHVWPSHDHVSLSLYMFICIVVIGSIFTRNKEIFNDYIQKAKDDLNANLNMLVSERTMELKKALAAKTEFLNNISHEIRTPVQGFLNISEGLVQHWDKFNNNKKLELAIQVAKNAKRLHTLVGNLLDLSRIAAGKMLLDLHMVDLNNLVLDIIEESKVLYINDKQIDFQFTAKKDANLVCDQERISQVLRNLVTNAIKFSPEHTTITIQISDSKIAGDDGGQIAALHLSIADQGIGIPENELGIIFSSFTQSSKTKTKAGGTGLGLAICHEIILAHHGKIWAENNINGGSTIHLVIPVSGPNGINNHQATSHNTQSVLNGHTAATPTVLIIDDEEASLISMELLLHGSEYKLVKASGGVEGLEYLFANQDLVDVILLDLMMPDMYGLDVLRKLKEHPKLSQIPVVLQSGIADEAEICKAYSMGVLAYIKKPYQKRLVISVLESCLNKRERAELYAAMTVKEV